MRARKPCTGYRCQALAASNARWCGACWRQVSAETRARLDRAAAFLASNPDDADARTAARAASRDAEREIADRRRAE